MTSNEKILRVAWFADIFDEVSGVITDTKEIYEQAKAHNIEWYPITCYKKELYPFLNFPIEMKFSTAKFYHGSAVYVPRFLDVVNFLKEKQINVIVSNTPAVMGMVAMSAAKYLRLPLVDIYHTDVDFYVDTLSQGALKPLFNSVAMNFLKLYQKQADLIFVRTKDFHKLISGKGHSAGKLRYYPAGVDSENFSPQHKDVKIWESFSLDKNSKKIIFVGRITKVKDILFALEYFRDKNPSQADFVLVGDGPDFSDYQEQFSSFANIHFLGIQQGDVLRKLYASADLLVLPSASETLGKTVLESMASGVAVLVSDKGGPKDYVDNGKNGFIFRAKDYESFCQVMDTALSSQTNLKLLGENAYQKISQYSMKKLFEKFSEDIQMLLV